MREFDNVQEAKRFLVGKIAAQAQREGEPLSQVEEKMLYFSETGWTLPEMDSVSAAFESECDEVKYEHKVAALIRNLRATAGKMGADEGFAWDAAMRLLRREDHYLIVLVDIAEGALAVQRHTGSSRRWLALVAYGAGAAATLFVIGYFALGIVKR